MTVNRSESAIDSAYTEIDCRHWLEIAGWTTSEAEEN